LKYHINGVKVDKSKFIIPEYALPAKDWLDHNEGDLSNKNVEIYAFIRNPLERVILQYLHQMKHRPALRQYPITFKEWCFASYTNSNMDKFMQNNPKEFLSQSKWLGDLNNYNLKVFNINDTILNKKMKFERVNIKDHYDDLTKDLISSWYAIDFHLLDELS